MAQPKSTRWYPRRSPIRPSTTAAMALVRELTPVIRPHVEATSAPGGSKDWTNKGSTGPTT